MSSALPSAGRLKLASRGRETGNATSNELVSEAKTANAVSTAAAQLLTSNHETLLDIIKRPNQA
jgi:hypothetical protein